MFSKSHNIFNKKIIFPITEFEIAVFKNIYSPPFRLL